jgi:hypothetical protein
MFGYFTTQLVTRIVQLCLCAHTCLFRLLQLRLECIDLQPTFIRLRVDIYTTHSFLISAHTLLLLIDAGFEHVQFGDCLC